jgi:alpha-D-ribose 1-methylphosphonate 5-triphosphate synthase subunit PhnH
MPDSLTTLRDVGYPVDQMSAAQRAVLAALTDQETTMLVALQLRLQAAEGEVTVHDMKLL